MGPPIVAEEIVPRAAREGLARFCDVFCEEGVFTVEESRVILEAGRRAGLGLRVHADELARSGGTLLAAELGAASADHLLFAGDEEIAALARSGTVAVILPGTAWWMRSRRAPARAMIEAGVPVAVASDANPGTCYTESLAAVAAHACLDSGLTVEETLTGCTLNAAASLGLADRIGSLETGKAADVIVLDAPDDRHLVYHWGVEPGFDGGATGRVVAALGRNEGRPKPKWGQTSVCPESYADAVREALFRRPRRRPRLRRARRPAAARRPRSRGPWAPRSRRWSRA